MIAYVLTVGEYSDYRILGVTLDHEKAMLFAKTHECEIEEYETDVVQLYADKEVYFCRETDDGRVWVSTIEPDGKDKEVLDVGTVKKIITTNWVTHKPNGYFYRMYTIAEDHDHAKKIFLDKLAEYKAREAGL